MVAAYGRAGKPETRRPARGQSGMTSDEKLDEALKGTFPASDAFYLPPEDAFPEALIPVAYTGADTA